jgi:hypothetical protein
LKAALLLLLLAIPHLLRAQHAGYAATVMAGISNQGKNPTDPYVAAGDRAYLIGTQDGNFPDLGGHVPGEMGGLWVHPIKLIDGFQGIVSDTAAGQERVLSKASEFINYPYGNRFRYGAVLDGLEIERFQFSPDGHPGVVVQYTFANTSGRSRELRFQLRVKTDLLPVWLSEKIGITDAPDTVIWQPATHRFLARDTRHRWFAVWGATTSRSSFRVLRRPMEWERAPHPVTRSLWQPMTPPPSRSSLPARPARQRKPGRRSPTSPGITSTCSSGRRRITPN